MSIPDKYTTSLAQSFVMQKVRGDVGFFKEKGGTVGWMINKKGIVVIDTQFKTQAHTLLTQIRSMSDLLIDILFNTHHHIDHTGGNIVLRTDTKQIIAHTNSAFNQSQNASLTQSESGQCYPDFTFDSEYNVTIGYESIKAIYLGPAHTNGDIIIHFENSNVVHIGDLVFNRCYPYIDIKSSGSIIHWIEVLNSIIEKYDKDTLFITGHAAPGYDVIITKDDLIAFACYLEQLLACGKEWINQNKSKDWVLENVKVIPKMDEWQGDGIERSIIAIYDSLSFL